MAGIRAIEGVDNTLVNIAVAAVAPLNPRPAVTVGPLDRAEDALRLNWFLYSIRPNPAYRNMEPPRTGTRTARGVPPMALELGYVLSAHPGPLTASGQQPQFADRGLAAVMQALHHDPVVAEGSALLAPEAAPLVEPLRITLDHLDLDTVSKIWTAASQPMRTTVGYCASLAVVDADRTYTPGPPVQERRLAAVPSLGPRFERITPPRVSAAAVFAVELTGTVGDMVFTVRRERDDPPGLVEWPVTPIRVAANLFDLQVAPPELSPGVRQLSVTATVGGLPAGGDRAAITLVPVVAAGPGAPIPAGATATLTTAHVAADVEVFFDGTALPAGDVTVVSPTQVDITVPPGAGAGPHRIMLRSAFVAGPPFDGLVVA